MESRGATLALFLLRNSDLEIIKKYADVNSFEQFDNGTKSVLESVGKRKKIKEIDDSVCVGESIPNKRISSRFVWVKFKETKAKWPVEITERNEDIITVYVRCDDANLQIKPADAFPFYENLPRMKEEGLAALKKMKKTLEAFKSDVEWALQEYNYCVQNAATPVDESENKNESTMTEQKERESEITVMESDQNAETPVYILENEDSNLIVQSEGESSVVQESESNEDRNDDESENENKSTIIEQKERESERHFMESDHSVEPLVDELESNEERNDDESENENESTMIEQKERKYERHLMESDHSVETPVDELESNEERNDDESENENKSTIIEQKERESERHFMESDHSVQTPVDELESNEERNDDESENENESTMIEQKERKSERHFMESDQNTKTPFELDNDKGSNLIAQSEGESDVVEEAESYEMTEQTKRESERHFKESDQNAETPVYELENEKDSNLIAESEGESNVEQESESYDMTEQTNRESERHFMKSDQNAVAPVDELENDKVSNLIARNDGVSDIIVIIEESESYDMTERTKRESERHFMESDQNAETPVDELENEDSNWIAESEDELDIVQEYESYDMTERKERGSERHFMESDQNAETPVDELEDENGPIFIAETEGESSVVEESESYDMTEVKKRGSEINHNVIESDHNADTPVDESENEKDSNLIAQSDGESDIVEESESNEDTNSIIHMPLSKKYLWKKKAHVKESEIVRDINEPGIYISKVLKSQTSSKAQRERKVDGYTRVYNYYHACYFCGDLKSHVKTHMDTCKEAKEFIGKSGKMFSKLLNEGDHKNNCKVIKNGYGELLLARRPTGLLDIRKFGPCPECHLWILLKNLRVHHVKCTEKLEAVKRQSKRRLIIQSQVLGGFISTSNKPSKLMLEEVFPSITPDEIGNLAKTDQMILALGERWLSKSIDNREKRKNYTSGHMRLMARLLIELRKLNNGQDADKKELSLYLRSAHFNLFVRAAIQCCTPYMDDIEDLKAPSNGIKLKYDVERVVSLRWAMLVKEDPHSILAKEMDVFQRLLSMEWGDRITKLSRAVLVRRQLSLKKELPSPQDVECLTKYLVKQLGETQLISENFFRIVLLAETRLLVYNKRRSGEIEALRLSNYAGRTIGSDDMDETLMDDLTKVEQYLLKTQELMKVRGKGTKPVAVIIPGDAKKALAFISRSSVRVEVGIPRSNTYPFPNLAGSYARAYESLKKTSAECDLRYPSRITSISMRKYTATLTQLLNLEKHELEWLCKHLGHSGDIHKKFYQQMSGLVERVYVSKMFLVQDLNLTSKYKHKALKDIDLEDIVFPEQVDNDVEQVESEEMLPTSNIEESEPADPCVFLDNGSSGEEDNDVGDDDIQACTSASKSNVKVKKHFKRTKWTQKEEEELKTYFKDYLEAKICPKRKDVDRIRQLSKKKDGAIWKRSNDKIIKKISNMNHK